MNKNKIEDILKDIDDLNAEDTIVYIYNQYKEKVAFATSLGEEDQVITHMISKYAPQMKIFTLDTGRLYQETYQLLEKTQKRYPMNIDIYFPDQNAVEQMVNQKGINLFYHSIDNRKLCCGIRKIEPLKRALETVDAWVVGLRREQSVTRSDLKKVEWDEGNQKIKFNPLIDWTYEQLQEYIKNEKIDVNPLHSEGFVSIGCAPCTRAIQPGEDIRAGRWWWEAPEQKECGLHNNPKRQAYLKEKKEVTNE